MTNTTILSREETLLLALARLSFSDKQKADITAMVEQGCDWSLFTSLVNDHGIIALCYSNLRDLELLDRVPETSRNVMAGARMKSIARNAVLLEKYNRVKELLEGTGIEPVLIKGMALELTIYGMQGVRQMNDIDILVEKDRVLEAWEMLRGRDYLSVPPKSPLHKRFMVYIGKHLPELFMDGIAFELHHTLFDQSHRSLLAALARDDNQVLQTEYDGQLYNILAPDIHFLYLVKHLHYHEQHGGAQVRQYLDLCQLMEQCTRDIRETGIMELAESCGLTSILLQKLYLMHRFWGFRLPSEVLDKLDDPHRKEAEKVFLHHLRKPKGNEGIRHEEEYLRTLKIIPGTWNKILYTIGDLVPSLSFMKFRYGTSTRFGAIFYYPVRWWRSVLILARKLFGG